jgi:seryl-tRNA synthetase
MRYRVSEKKEPVRNLYATAAAVQRLICAISENHYDAKTNSIKIPGVLRKYTMGIEEIKLDK